LILFEAERGFTGSLTTGEDNIVGTSIYSSLGTQSGFSMVMAYYNAVSPTPTFQLLIIEVWR
jgi:hypothetical protein